MVVTERDFIYHSEAAGPDGRGIAVRWEKIDENYSRSPEWFDPRLIGIMPIGSPALSNFEADLELLLMRPDRGSCSVVSEMLSGQRTSRVEYTREDGVIIRMWIASNKGPSIVRAESQFAHRDGEVLDFMQCQIR